jgi:mono/diheme cytochrome c family protein
VFSRFRSLLIVTTLFLGGCGDVLQIPPPTYRRSEDLGTLLGTKPTLQSKVVEVVDRNFGAQPREIRVPRGSGLPGGGIHLAAYASMKDPDGEDRRPVFHRDDEGNLIPQAGGYELYRRHCLHCHGVSGDGYGPTAPFLFPRPRDFRRGIFKFTSTGSKPTRDDLVKTVRDGLHGTSMPAYEALMSPAEIEQVVDYVMFLSMRGEFEYRLIQEVKDLDDNDPEALPDDIIDEILELSLITWSDADALVRTPDTPRTPPSPESIARGKQLYLGRTAEKLQCSGCHGTTAQGNGPSWVDMETFEHYVFRLDTSRARFEALGEYAESRQKLWKDDWGDPIRPANLTKGVYKGGRRPIDLYWRIYNGIGQAVMPAHSNLKSDQIWDLVNFLFALPHEPELLADVSDSQPIPVLADLGSETDR